jgi:hypothetical protein
MQFKRPSLRGLCVALVVSLAAPPVVVAAPAKGKGKGKKQEAAQVQPTDRNLPLDPETPAAGDEAIPDDEVEPGQIKPGSRPTGKPSGPGPSVGISRKPNIGTDALALQFDAEATAAFDAGQYPEAARLWTRALEALPENATNHVPRAAMLLNAVTAYEQVYVENGDVEVLKRAQLVIGDYLRACKKRYGSGCDRYQETVDVRKRLDELVKRIDAAAPKIKKVPPEIDTAPGGRAFNRGVKLPPTPAWIGPAFAGGIALTGGGIALAYWAETDYDTKEEAKAKAEMAENVKIHFREEGDSGTTGDGGDTGDTGDTGGTTGSTGLTAPEIPEYVKGNLLTALGVLMAASGVGLVVLSSIKLAKHKRLNRERASSLSLVPTFNRGGAGIGLSGRF